MKENIDEVHRNPEVEEASATKIKVAINKNIWTEIMKIKNEVTEDLIAETATKMIEMIDRLNVCANV